MRSTSLFSASLFFVGLPLLAQTSSSGAHALAKAATVAQPDGLRVTHVSLYKNGVGFFEHEGAVSGDATVRLDLTSSQLNDVLQTLIAIDRGGGHITGANFNSTTPLEQQLQTLPFSLGEQPSEEQLYAALRGARVEVTGSGPVFTGRILALEIVDGPQVDDKGEPETEKTLLTVVADSGSTRTLVLTSTTTVRLLDAGLRTDLNTYLELLDRNRTEGVRHLTLSARGNGTRQLRVSFLSEVPVWKSTYRVLMTSPMNGVAAANEKATLQGFSVVDNTTGEDWNDVRLSLIAGNPQSFLQPLAQPIYDRRQEIPIAANSQMTPQTHESANEENVPASSASAQFGIAGAGNPASLLGGDALRMGSPKAGNGAPMAGGRRISGGIRMMKDTAAPPPPAMGGPIAMSYEDAVASSTAANTTVAAFDDFFAYNVTDPVTIPRNGSALVPILQVQVPTESVTLWSPAEPRPLRALWVTNDSQLTLDRGAFSVVEDGAFAGQGLMEPVHPGERRLLSYALDEAVRVTPNDRHDAGKITSVTVSGGVLHAVNVEESETNYTVSNAASAARTVVIEEPRREGWKLAAETKAAETTPNAYRFEVVAAPHAPAHLKIVQRHTLDESFRLVDTSEENLTLLLRRGGVSESTLAQLQPVFAAKRDAVAIDGRISEAQMKINAITEDQKRVRDDLAVLKGSPEERALARRYTGELNAQEDMLAGLRRDLASLLEQRSAAAAELSRRVQALQITGTA